MARNVALAPSPPRRVTTLETLLHYVQHELIGDAQFGKAALAKRLMPRTGRGGMERGNDSKMRRFLATEQLTITVTETVNDARGCGIVRETLRDIEVPAGTEVLLYRRVEAALACESVAVLTIGREQFRLLGDGRCVITLLPHVSSSRPKSPLPYLSRLS